MHPILDAPSHWSSWDATNIKIKIPDFFIERHCNVSTKTKIAWTWHQYCDQKIINTRTNSSGWLCFWQSCGFTVANGVHANSNLLMSINRGGEHFLRAKSSNFLPTYGPKCDGLKRGQKTGGGWTLPGVNLEPVPLLSVGRRCYKL